MSPKEFEQFSIGLIINLQLKNYDTGLNIAHNIMQEIKIQNEEGNIDIEEG